VYGTYSPSQVVTWSIDGGNPTGVSISSGGVLTVESTAATGTITIRATSTVAGYTNISGTKVVMINAPSTPPPLETDFTTETNANLLGLYPSGNYADATTLIAAMDARINTSFYNAAGGYTVNPDDIYGITNVYYNQIVGAAPSMAWIINGDDLIVYGWNDTNATIVFNIAVINETTGEGWITGDENNSPYGETYLRSYSSLTSGSEKISISNLTGSDITTVIGLTGYKVYVIVRWTGNFSSGRDFNDNGDALNLLNVISVTVP
jgi:hypothetical protein